MVFIFVFMICMFLAGSHVIPNLGQTTENTQESDKFSLYNDDKSGIRILYPSHWLVQESESSTKDPLVPVSLQYPTEDISVSIQVYNSPGANLDEFLNSLIAGNKDEFQDYKVRESNTDATLAGHTAFKLVDTLTDEIYGKQKVMQVGTLKDGKVYSVAYFAPPDKYSRYLPVIQQMIDSFEITSPSQVSDSDIIDNPPPIPDLDTTTTTALPPKANDLTVTTSMNTPITLTFSGSGSADLKVAIVSNPTNGQLGTIDQSKGTVEYVPSDGFVGTDSFRYLVNDGSQDSSPATATINVRNGTASSQNILGAADTTNITTAGRNK